MAFTKLTKDMDIIQKLDDEPNDAGGLTAAQLKAKFDEGNNAVKEWINNTFIPEAEETLRLAQLESVPTHASRHAEGGNDPLTPAMLGAYSLNVCDGIPENANLDAYITPGNYAVRDTVAATLSNCPTNGAAFKLVVERCSDAADGLYKQRAIVFGDATEYWRVYQANTWSPWAAVLFTGMGFAKIQTGSYAGTGTYGSDNPCSLTFDFVPKAVIITAEGVDTSDLRYYDHPILINAGDGTPQFLPLTGKYSSAGACSDTVKFTFSGQELSWHATEVDAQHNAQDVTYRWMAVG